HAGRDAGAGRGGVSSGTLLAMAGGTMNSDPQKFANYIRAWRRRTPHDDDNGSAARLNGLDSSSSRDHHLAAINGFSDSFREIRTRLLALGGARNFATLVVPVRPGSGASFVARNLAAAFAFSEARSALLIDC